MVGILELRIGGLPAHAVEPADILRVQSAGELRERRQARDAVQILHARAAQERRLLAAEDVREAQPRFQDRDGVTVHVYPNDAA